MAGSQRSAAGCHHATAVPAISECLWRRNRTMMKSLAHRPQSPRFQSACGGRWRRVGQLLQRNRSPRDFRVLVADDKKRMPAFRCFTAVPAISECLWRRNAEMGRLANHQPQSPRFQSACGGNMESKAPTDDSNRSPRDFRVLVAAFARRKASAPDLTAVPAISECLWRRTWPWQ